MTNRLERANAIRALSIDAVQAAQSGHPGAPMGLADIAEVLWRDVLKHNPADPNWCDRDRFVLSNGHSSMLLYSVLHLCGYEVSIEDIRQFRQLHSVTAGHPERGECPGVETTTGPLGQGFANAVGMALAESLLAKKFNRPGHEIVDHRTWVIVGDGCLMEGISHEAASLAGTLGFGRLVAIYDDNGISIDGDVSAWFNEDVPARFESYGWEVIRDVNGHDGDGLAEVIKNLKRKENSRPILICCKTIIGFGSPKVRGTAKAHGSPLGTEEISATREELKWPHGPFEIPSTIYEDWDCREQGSAAQLLWEEIYRSYCEKYPELGDEFNRCMKGDLPQGWNLPLRELAEKSQLEMESLETRKSSQRCITALSRTLPELFGGSADLSGSNGTKWTDADSSQYINFGVREFGMTAITNGMCLHGGFITFSGTFLVFMEYARNALRLSALMGIRNIFVYTHDSVAVGEDGPTHQPIEQLTNLRTTPGLCTWRPCDTVESAIAWEVAVAERNRPSALIFTRQKTALQPRESEAFSSISRGGYVLVRETGKLSGIIIATGSEVELAVEAARILSEAGYGIRVVSMPCSNIFLEQQDDYRESVLPSHIKARVAVEAGHPDYWYRFVGLDGAVVGIDGFGLSGPGPEVMQELGITVAQVVLSMETLVRGN